MGLVRYGWNFVTPIPTRARAKHNGKEMDFFCLTHEGTYVYNVRS